MRHCAPRFGLRLALVMVNAMTSLRRTQTRREVRSESMDAICIFDFYCSCAAMPLRLPKSRTKGGWRRGFELVVCDPRLTTEHQSNI